MKKLAVATAYYYSYLYHALGMGMRDGHSSKGFFVRLTVYIFIHVGMTIPIYHRKQSSSFFTIMELM